MKKIFLALFFVFVFTISASAKIMNNSQILPNGHWVYDACGRIFAESKTLSCTSNSQLTVSEIKFYLALITPESLSEKGQSLYEKVYSFLNTEMAGLRFKGAGMFGNVIINPEFYVKTNENLDFSFDTFIKDNAVTFPIAFTFSDYVAIESDFFLGKFYSAIHKKGNFTNIPYNGNDFEFLQPQFSYGAFGYTFKDWGVNLILGKEGFQIGDSITGSVIYNKTFKTDFYAQLNLFSEYINYNVDVAQAGVDRFLYLHHVEIRPFKNFKLSVLEGSLVNHPFELRFLNPFMIGHSFAGWTQYKDLEDNEWNSWYGSESKFCAYLAFNFEYIPFKNSKFYFNFSQTEIQSKAEIKAGNQQPYMPNGMAFQFGNRTNIAAPYGGIFCIDSEFFYTTPYMYVKSGREWSLVSVTKENRSGGQEIINWIGLPYGPDCIGGQIDFTWKNYEKWNLGISYTMIAHGENRKNMFTKKDGKYDYFPSVPANGLKNLSEEEKDELYKKARNMFPSETVEYMNRITIKSGYVINRYFACDGQMVYSVFNNFGNEKGKVEQGLEFAISGTFRLF